MQQIGRVTTIQTIAFLLKKDIVKMLFFVMLNFIHVMLACWHDACVYILHMNEPNFFFSKNVDC